MNSDLTRAEIALEAADLAVEKYLRAINSGVVVTFDELNALHVEINNARAAVKRAHANLRRLSS